MKGRATRSGAPSSADLLVCFPSRAHLTLMPKPICSSQARGRGSPNLWAKTKVTGQGETEEEPSSPKVTCAGQIRVTRSSSSSKKKKKGSWVEALGLKKDVLQFLTCLRSLRLDLTCFGSLPAGADVTSDEDDDEEDDEDEDERSRSDQLSKWFMALQEDRKDDDEEEVCVVAPRNALLLMRCRSAPAKTLSEEQEQESGFKIQGSGSDPEQDQEKEQGSGFKDQGSGSDPEQEQERGNSVLMRCDTDYYYKTSSDIAKETWVVGGTRDVLSRSRSSKQ